MGRRTARVLWLMACLGGPAGAAEPVESGLVFVVLDEGAFPVPGVTVALWDAGGEAVGSGRTDVGGRLVWSAEPGAELSWRACRAGFVSAGGRVLVQESEEEPARTEVIVDLEHAEEWASMVPCDATRGELRRRHRRWRQAERAAAADCQTQSPGE